MKRRRFLISSGVAAVVIGSCSVYWPERWKYIVVHYSAGDFGTIEFLQEVHRDRQPGDPIDAIPYHYVNGNGLGLGEIASDWRCQFSVWGAHLSADNKRINFLGLGTCLIGNFEASAPLEPQFQALLLLKKTSGPIWNRCR